MDVIFENVTDKEDELKCYKYLEKIKKLLKYIPNNDFKNTYRLNAEGLKKYPKLNGHVFVMEQIENFVFQVGSEVDLFL